MIHKEVHLKVLEHANCHTVEFYKNKEKYPFHTSRLENIDVRRYISYMQKFYAIFDTNVVVTY
jgi:hypothetical protein